MTSNRNTRNFAGIEDAEIEDLLSNLDAGPTFDFVKLDLISGKHALTIKFANTAASRNEIGPIFKWLNEQGIRPHRREQTSEHYIVEIVPVATAKARNLPAAFANILNKYLYREPIQTGGAVRIIASHEEIQQATAARRASSNPPKPLVAGAGQTVEIAQADDDTESYVVVADDELII